MTSVRKHLEAMGEEPARLLRAHARGEHRFIPMRSCAACLRFHFDEHGHSDRSDDVVRSRP